MEDKSRIAQSPRPRRKRPQSSSCPHKLKALSTSSGVRELSDSLPHSPAQPKASLAALPPPPSTSGNEEGREDAPQLVKNPTEARLHTDAGARPTPAAAYPYNIDVEALTKNVARLIEEGGRAVAAYFGPNEAGTQKMSYS